ncbi:MAG TPA: thiol:disulfide interchange protein DsbA/DsbL [Rhodocyclaceae bacterium]|nr:thiol:disulfide interchange protein DsbA/DsbL [Rhodocyclaceae bacterium]
MNRRNVLQVLSALLLTALMPFSHAQVLGKDYTLISPPQPSATNGQIEVIEFFSFACPHCNEFDPLLSKWRAALPKDVVFHRSPVSFGRPDWADLQHVYLTLNAMGLSDKLDSKVFDGVHKEHVNFSDEKARDQWLTKHGVDVKKFDDTWRSFGVASMIRRAEQMSETYKIQGVPTLTVDGRFMILGAEHEDLLKNATLVIAKVRAEKAAKK